MFCSYSYTSEMLGKMAFIAPFNYEIEIIPQGKTRYWTEFLSGAGEELNRIKKTIMVVT